MTGRLPITTTGLPTVFPGCAGSPRLQTLPRLSVNCTDVRGCSIIWDSSRCAITSAVESRRLALLAVTATGTSCAVATIPVSSTMVATRTSISVKPRCLIFRLAIAVRIFFGPSRYLELLPRARCIGPDFDGSGRQHHYRAKSVIRFADPIHTGAGGGLRAAPSKGNKATGGG